MTLAQSSTERHVGDGGAAPISPHVHFLPVAPAVVALTDAATIVVDASLGSDFRVTLGASRTLGSPSNPADGQRIDVMVTQGGSGSYTLSYGSAYKFGTGLASPTLSTSAGAIDVLGFIYNAAAAKWLFVAFVNGF